MILLSIVFSSCAKFEVEKSVYKGITKHGTTIGLIIQVKNSKLNGYGFHVFRSGKQNFVTLKGNVDESGKYSIGETILDTKQVFGNISGEFIEDKHKLIGVWTNSEGADRTEIILNKTYLSLDEVLSSIVVEKKQLAKAKKSPSDIVEDTKSRIKKWYYGN